MRTQKRSKNWALSAVLQRSLAALLLCGLTTILIGVSQGFQTPGAANPSAIRKAFNKSEIVELLKLETPDVLLIPKVRTAGIDFEATQGDLESFAKMGASDALLAVIREASKIQRAKEGEAPYKAKGYLVAHIMTIKAGPEDAIVGRQDNGDYFKATATSWTRLGLSDLTNLQQDIKDDLNTTVDHPLVWLVNREHIEDKDFTKNYEALLNNTRIAQFGHIPSTVIMVLLDRSIPTSAMLGDDGKIIPSRMALCHLSKDHCKTAPQ